MSKSFKEQVYHLVDDDNKAGVQINPPITSFIMILIILSIIAVILESDVRIAEKYSKIFLYFEYFAVAIFTLEYLARAWTCTLEYPNLSPWKAFWKFFWQPMSLIDLLAILPTYLMFLPLDARFLRVLRLLRLLRLFKLNRYTSSMKLIGTVLREEKEKLFITLFMTGILLVLSSALVYEFESNGPNAENWPHIYGAFWWAIATLTTVGYGDVFPVTPMGKIVAGIIALLGIGLVALPTGILSGSFVSRIDAEKKLAQEEKERLEKEAQGLVDESPAESYPFKFCPHCGDKLEGHSH